MSSTHYPVYQIKPTGFQPEIGRAAWILQKIRCVPDEPIRDTPSAEGLGFAENQRRMQGEPVVVTMAMRRVAECVH